jgi:hypothetical protein
MCGTFWAKQQKHTCSSNRESKGNKIRLSIIFAGRTIIESTEQQVYQVDFLTVVLLSPAPAGVMISAVPRVLIIKLSAFKYTLLDELERVVAISFDASILRNSKKAGFCLMAYEERGNGDVRC